jgi:hypothetical protein
VAETGSTVKLLHQAHQAAFVLQAGQSNGEGENVCSSTVICPRHKLAVSTEHGAVGSSLHGRLEHGSRLCTFSFTLKIGGSLLALVATGWIGP